MREAGSGRRPGESRGGRAGGAAAGLGRPGRGGQREAAPGGGSSRARPPPRGGSAAAGGSGAAAGRPRATAVQVRGPRQVGAGAPRARRGLRGRGALGGRPGRPRAWEWPRRAASGRAALALTLICVRGTAGCFRESERVGETWGVRANSKLRVVFWT